MSGASAALLAMLAVGAAALAYTDTGGRRSPVAVGAVAVLSIVWTAVSADAGTGLAVGLLTLAENLAVLVAVAFVAARAELPAAGVTVMLSVGAVGASVLRPGAATGPAPAVQGCVAWGLLVLGAAAAGLHLRSLAARQAAEAGREHRLRLAADLHDAAAKDVGEVLALTQAGRIVSKDSWAVELFDAIERAAQHSTTSLDRAAAALGDAIDAAAAADADGKRDRHADTGGATDGDAVADDPLPHSERATITRTGPAAHRAPPAASPRRPAASDQPPHRIVTEALTDIRAAVRGILGAARHDRRR